MNRMILTAIAILLTSCSTFRGPPPPKLYDNAKLVITSDEALLIPQTIEKEFLRILRLRLNEYTESEIQSNGDLKVVAECGPRTLRIVQDIASINIATYTQVRAGVFSASSKKKDDINLTIHTTVEDCATGAKLGKFSHQSDGVDLVEVLQDLASSNVSDAYKFQRASR